MIKFNSEALVTDLRQKCIEALTQAQDELFYDTLFEVTLSEAMTDYERTEIVEEIVGVLSCKVKGGAWAVMDEWGTGSLMDLNNPFLNDYWNSGLWNPARKDTVIRTRPGGTYTDIFGDSQHAEGRNPGFNLERELNNPNRKTPPDILLTPPSHAMQQAIGWLRAGGFRIILRRVFQELDIGKYIEVEVTGSVRS